MNNTELLTKIKSEIERLKNKMDDRDPLAPNQQAGYLFALADVLSFLSTLESEKSKNQDGLVDEYEDYVERDPFYSKLVNRHAGIDIARHFAKWGAEHLKK